MSDTFSHQIGFIGAGNMAEAIIRAAIDHHVVPASKMIVFDPSPARCELFASIGVSVGDDNADVIASAQQVVLAIKPQMIEKIKSELQNIKESQILVSIMAGVGSQKIEQLIDRPLRIVRVMPNTPLLAGQGMAGVALGMNAKPGDDELAIQLMNAAGKAISVDENALDAITAVSGSGPAYLFYLAEAMEQAADDLGLGENARLLVQQTILGAATLLSESPDSAAELRKKVTSPGGTTQAATNCMDQNGMRDIIIRAVCTAEQRSKELGG